MMHLQFETEDIPEMGGCLGANKMKGHISHDRAKKEKERESFGAKGDPYRYGAG